MHWYFLSSAGIIPSYQNVPVYIMSWENHIQKGAITTESDYSEVQPQRVKNSITQY